MSILHKCLNSQLLTRNGLVYMICQRNCANNSVRVRFAPSPTGFIHLGGLRTAFYNYLFSKKYNGKFILRIEDTDQERVVPGSLEHIIETLKWSDLVPDEGPHFGGSFGPYIQSERIEIYKDMTQRLLETDSVYRCFCTPKRLELLRREAAKNRETIKYDNRCRLLTKSEIQENLNNDKPYAIRLRLKDGPLCVNDMIYGSITYDLSKIEGDPIIVKSDGLPTYHFANVIDDYMMQISHVLRGVEWLVSTPKHLMLYESFGWKPPIYAHLPLIINKDGSKLSKRHDHIRIDTYRNKGYFPETINNYLTQMGGGFVKLDPVATNHIYPMKVLIDSFELETINQNNCKIDTDKLKMLNRNTIKEYCKHDIQQLIEEIRKMLRDELKIDDNQLTSLLDDKNYIRSVIEWSLDRIYSIHDLMDNDFLFVWSQPKYTWQPSLIAPTDVIIPSLKSALDVLKTITEDDLSDSTLILNKLKDSNQNLTTLKYGSFMKLLRYSLTNLKVGPPVVETIQLLGLKRSIQYLESAIQYAGMDHDCKNQKSNSCF